MVCILLIYGKYLPYTISLLRGWVGPNELMKFRFFLLMCLYESQESDMQLQICSLVDYYDTEKETKKLFFFFFLTK